VIVRPRLKKAGKGGGEGGAKGPAGGGKTGHGPVIKTKGGGTGPGGTRKG